MRQIKGKLGLSIVFFPLLLFPVSVSNRKTLFNSFSRGEKRENLYPGKLPEEGGKENKKLSKGRKFLSENISVYHL
jgi:hypothetical protein